MILTGNKAKLEKLEINYAEWSMEKHMTVNTGEGLRHTEGTVIKSLVHLIEVIEGKNQGQEKH